MDWPLGLGCLEFVNFQRRPWHLALLALQVCVLGTATGSGQEGRLQFGSWSTQTLGENPKCWWSLMVVDGRCDRWGSLWSWWFFGVFPKILGNYCSTCRNIPTHLMPESEIDFPKFVAWSFGSSKHSKHHVPHTKMGFGSGIWTLAPRDLCFAQDIEPEPVSPYTVPDFKTKKTSFLCGVDRACHVVTSQRLATNHAHISWIHPIARWGILWRPTLRVHILICKDLCISVHIYTYLPKLSPNFVDNRHPQALSAPSCRYQPPVASRALPWHSHWAPSRQSRCCSAPRRRPRKIGAWEVRKNPNFKRKLVSF